MGQGMVALEKAVLGILKREPAGLSNGKIYELLRKEYPSEKYHKKKMYATLHRLEKEGVVNSKRTHYVKVWRAIKSR